jgi:hypothetical protein
MKRNLAVACLAGLTVGALVMAAGCAQPQGPAATAPAAKAADGWTVVYTSDFTGSGKLPAAWQALAGEAKIEGGALVLTAPSDEGQLVLLEPRCPGSVRLECVASLKGDPISDISPFLNADTSGYNSGYLFQFGGKANTINCLCRYDDHIAATEKDKPLVKPGQKYRILAENDGGRLRLAIDGQEIFQYTDPEPLKGQTHDRVGFYTYGCTLVIEKLTVSTKPAKAAGK